MSIEFGIKLFGSSNSDTTDHVKAVGFFSLSLAEEMLTISSGFLHVDCLHVVQQPLSAGRTIGKEALTLGEVSVPIQGSIGMESIELNEMVLGVGEELRALVEALGMG